MLVYSKDTINTNVLNNDKLLIKKVVEILEGKNNYNENFKIEETGENTATLKIILNVKNGISIVMFTCKLVKTILRSEEEILLISMKFFKKKIEVKNDLGDETNSVLKRIENNIKTMNTISSEMEKKQDLMSEKVFLKYKKYYIYL
jgi:hypothetical protein